MLGKVTLHFTDAESGVSGLILREDPGAQR